MTGESWRGVCPVVSWSRTAHSVQIREAVDDGTQPPSPTGMATAAADAVINIAEIRRGDLSAPRASALIPVVRRG